MLGAAGIRRDVGQVDVGLLCRAELDLGLLRSLLEALQGQGVVAQIHALFLLELLHQEVDDAHVEVLATEEGVPVGGEHFELVLAFHLGDLDDGDIEGTATEVIDRDLLVAGRLVETIGQRRRGRLVDDPLHVQPGNAAGILGGLALGIVEVGRYGDDRLGHFLAEIVFGGLLHLLQHLGRDLGRRHLLAVHLHPGVTVVRLDDLVGDHLDVPLHHFVIELAADEALDGEQGVVRVGHGLALGRLAHQYLALGRECHYRRGGAITLRVFDDLGLVPLHHCDAGVGGTQIDADNLAHLFSPLYF